MVYDGLFKVGLDLNRLTPIAKSYKDIISNDFQISELDLATLNSKLINSVYGDRFENVESVELVYREFNNGLLLMVESDGIETTLIASNSKDNNLYTAIFTDLVTKETGLLSLIQLGILLPIYEEVFDAVSVNEDTQVSDIPPNDAEVQITVLNSDKPDHKLVRITESSEFNKDYLSKVFDNYNNKPVLDSSIEYLPDEGIAYIKSSLILDRLSDKYLSKFIKSIITAGVGSVNESVDLSERAKKLGYVRLSLSND